MTGVRSHPPCPECGKWTVNGMYCLHCSWRILPPPPRPKYDLVTSRPEVKRRRFGIVPVFLLAALTVGVLVWGLTGSSRSTAESPAAGAAPRTPASTHVDWDPQPMTQSTADKMAESLLVAYGDPKHFDFVFRNMQAHMGCNALAWVYRGPDGGTDPRSVPDDIEPTVIGRAHWKDMRMTVWWKC